MAATTRGLGQDRGALHSTPEIIVEEDEENMKQHQQVQPSPSRGQHVSSTETADIDNSSSAKSKRPHVPYSQREIYEKKTVATRAPPRAGPICSKRSASNTADSGSTPVRQPAASPAYSHSRTTTSPSISTTSGTATGRSTSVNRYRTVTPMRGTGATPRGANTAPREGTGEPAHTPTASGSRAAAARPPLEKPQPLSRPSVDWQHQYQSPHQQNTQPMARTPTSARSIGLGYPATGMRAPSPGPGRTVATPTSNSVTPMSARLGRAQSASRPYRPTLPQPQAQAKPSPAKVSSSPHVTSPPPPPAGKAHGSPVKPAASPLPLPAWNPSTSKMPSPTPATPNMPGSAGRPPRKTIDASGGGSDSPAAIPASSSAKASASPAAAMAAAAAAAVARGVISGVDQGGSGGGFGPQAAVAAAATDAGGCYGLMPSLSTSSTNDCAAFRDAQPEGARSADAATEAKLLGCGADAAARAAGKEPVAAGTDSGASEGQESLGLIDLEGSDSLSICGSKAAHAGVPAKGVLLVPTPSCADGSEAVGTPGATEAERAAAAVLAGDGAAERAARHCGCAVM